MDLFTYLMAKSGNNSSVHGDLFSYLLGKGKSQVKTISGVTIYIPDAKKKKIVELILDKESTQHTTTGKNLFDEALLSQVSGYNTYSNGKWTCPVSPNNLYNRSILYDAVGYDYDRDANKIIVVKPNTTYTLKFYDATMVASSLGYYTLNGAYINAIDFSSNLFSFTTPNDCERIDIRRTNNNSQLVFSKIMLVEGTYTSDNFPSYEEYTGGLPSPSPEFPQSIKTVKGYSNLAYIGWADDFVSRINDSTKAVIQIYDGRRCLYYAASAGYQEYDTKYLFTTNWKANTQYTLSCDLKPTVNNTSNLAVVYTDGTYTPINPTLSANTWGSFSFTTLANKTVKYIRPNWSSGFCNLDLDTFMITEGTEEHPYVPYGSNYVDVNISDGTNTNQVLIPLNNNEIVGIGDYKDELIVDKTGHVYLNKKTGKYTFTGNEIWKDYASSPEGCYRAYTEDVKLGLTSTLSYDTLLSNRFNAVAYINMNSINLTQYATYLNIDNTIVNNASDLKTYLGNNTTYLYYVLATENLIDLNTTVDIELFKGANTITNSAGANMTIKYY